MDASTSNDFLVQWCTRSSIFPKSASQDIDTDTTFLEDWGIGKSGDDPVWVVEDDQ